MSSAVAVSVSLLASDVSSVCVPTVVCRVATVWAYSLHGVLCVLVYVVLTYFCLGVVCVVFV